MNIEDFKKRLSEKIDSQAAFIKLLKEAGVYSGYLPTEAIDAKMGLPTGKYTGTYDFYSITDHLNMRGYANERVSYQRWWYVRELLRLNLSYTNVPWRDIGLRSDSFSPWLTPHISTKDPERLAYTASIEDGERDVQRTVSLARFLRTQSAFWNKPDEAIAAYETALRAELTAELTLLPSEFIPIVYENGPSSCMRYTGHDRLDKYWKAANLGCHVMEPLVNAPGFRIAVTRADAESFSQRAVVWENPDNPTDKRYMRIYGSGPLERRLAKHGYVKGSFVGTKLRAVTSAWQPEDEGTNSFVIPYLDSMGTSNNNEQGVVVGDWVHIVKDTQAALMANVGIECFPTSGTDGFESATAYTQQQLEWTDAFGNKYSYLTAVPVDVMTEQGVVKLSSSDVSENYAQYRTLRDGNVTHVYAASTTPYFDSGRWLDTPENRLYNGYVLLDEAIYEALLWEIKSYTVTTGTGQIIRKQDACRLYREDCTYELAHKDHVPDRKLYKRVRMVDGVPTLVKRTMESVEVTARYGKKVVGIPGIHPELVKALNGKVYWEGNTTRILVMSHSVTVPDSWEDVKFTAEIAEKVKQQVSQCSLSPTVGEFYKEVHHCLASWRTGLPYEFGRRVINGEPDTELLQRMREAAELPNDHHLPELHNFWVDFLKLLANEMEKVENVYRETEAAKAAATEGAYYDAA